MIYLDNAATTKPKKEAVDAVINCAENFGNPSSLHGLGLSAEKIITECKEKTAKILGVEPKNIYFTSGGTESNNTAILGYARANKKTGLHLITTKIEHPSVLEPFHILEKEGFSVTYLSCDKSGKISLEEFENALRDDTILVSAMLVNNETGTVLPIDKMKAIMKQKAKKAVLHTDAVQGFLKTDINLKKMGVDMMSASGHKIHALKGTGILYIKDGVKILPIIAGGGQQKNMRSGTENVPGIAAFSAAVSSFSPINPSVCKSFKNKILEKIPDVKINGGDENFGYILNVSFLGVKAEILLHSLESHKIYVSTGSACSSNKPMPSHVLTAMGCTKKEIEGAVRFSFSEEFDEDFVIEKLAQEVKNIRKYVR